MEERGTFIGKMIGMAGYNGYSHKTLALTRGVEINFFTMTRLSSLAFKKEKEAMLFLWQYWYTYCMTF